MQGAAFRFGLILFAAVMLSVTASLARAEKTRERANGGKDQRSGQNNAPTATVTPAPSTPHVIGGSIPIAPQNKSEPDEYKYTCNPSRNREDADSCSQRDSAYASIASAKATEDQALWAKLAAVIGFATAVVTYWAARAAADAANASRASAEEARKSNEQNIALFTAGNRPWLGVESIKIENAYATEGNAYFSFLVTIKNYGGMPAHCAKISIQNVEIDTEVPQKLIIKDFIDRDGRGGAVFPGNTIELRAGVVAKGADGKANGAMAGAIGYKFAGADGHCITWFNFVIKNSADIFIDVRAPGVIYFAAPSLELQILGSMGGAS